MNYFVEIEKKIRNLVDKKIEKFIIYPFGEKGAMTKGILECIFNITDVVVVDTILSTSIESIVSVEQIGEYYDDDTYVLIASDNATIYNEIREKLYQYVPKNHCVELLPTIVEKKVNKYPDICEIVKKDIKVGPSIYKPQNTNSLFYLPLKTTDLIQQQIFMRDDYFESEEFKAVLKYNDGIIAKRITKGGGVLDIGANIGNHTLFYCNEIGAKMVYAFEPIKSTFLILENNIKINGLRDRVKLFNCGCGSSSGKAGVSHYDISNIGGTRLNEEDGNIDICRIDDIDINCEIVFIKIDVEGMETEVLKGSINCLKKYHPIIQIESFNDKYSEMDNFMKKMGYHCAERLGDNDFLYDI